MKRSMPDADLSKRSPVGIDADCVPDERSARGRILTAAFDVLRERGYGATQTREIAARAKVSKRDIYSEFGSKEGIFGALIAARAEHMRRPTIESDVSSREAFAATLVQAGVAVLSQLYDPAVVAMFRMAIASAEESPEMARILERNAFRPNQRARVEMMASAVQAGLVNGDASQLSQRFVGLLTGGTHVSVLLGLTDPPKARALARDAQEAAAAFLRLFGR
jgi:AcrR family transcriptional regulator